MQALMCIWIVWRFVSSRLPIHWHNSTNNQLSAIISPTNKADKMHLKKSSSGLWVQATMNSKMSQRMSFINSFRRKSTSSELTLPRLMMKIRLLYHNLCHRLPIGNQVTNKCSNRYSQNNNIKIKFNNKSNNNFKMQELPKILLNLRPLNLYKKKLTIMEELKLLKKLI